MQDELGRGLEAVGSVEGGECWIAEEANSLDRGKLVEEAREQACAEAVVAVGRVNGDILDVGAERAVGDGAGEADEGGAIPGGNGGASGEGLSDVAQGAVGPPAEEIVQVAHGARGDGVDVVGENVERVHASMLPTMGAPREARARGWGRLHAISHSAWP